MVHIGKKGSILDMFYYLAVFLFFGIIILISIYLADQILPDLQTEFASSSDALSIMNTAKAGYSTVDNLFIFLYFTLCIAPIIFAVMVKVSPIFIFINVIMFVIFFLVAPSISNVMYEFWNQPEFSKYAYGGSSSYIFPGMTRVFQYLPYISMGLATILMIAMFAKRDEG